MALFHTHVPHLIVAEFREATKGSSGGQLEKIVIELGKGLYNGEIVVWLKPIHELDINSRHVDVHESHKSKRDQAQRPTIYYTAGSYALVLLVKTAIS